MKLSISLSDDDVRLLDEYVSTSGAPSRSAAVQRSIRLLRYPRLERDYVTAFAEWDADGDDAVWDSASADGLPDAPR